MTEYLGVLHYVYPYWTLDCDNPIDEYTAGCDDGYTGMVYFNGNDHWVISLSSDSNDYYNVLTTPSTKYFIPFSATWTNTETKSGISQSTYQLSIQCDEAITSEPTFVTAAAERRVETAYIYDRTWFWITIILCLLFLLVICFLVWICNKKRKEKPNLVQFDAKAPREDVELQRGESSPNLGIASPQSANMPNISVPRHHSIPTASGQITPYTPEVTHLHPSPNQLIPDASLSKSPPTPVHEAEDGNNQTTTGIEWNDEDDKIFKV